MKILKNVILTDLSNYDSDNCRTGGAYSFSTHFFLVGEFKGTAMYQASYTSSSDFEYCSRCGSFHSECNNNFDLYTLEEVKKAIQTSEEDGWYEIYQEYEN